ncbi:MAG TPA: thiamine pyrophosphate-dependent enzyme [Stellaceae bacterium]|nr:thiamine pyrophosphate-dependent enzyme [Stellaceae bacterium]
MPDSRTNVRTAAQLLVAELVAHGVDRVFCVPGESYLAVLDALYDERRIDVVTCRHESGAGFMAVTDAKLTGRPGIAMVSRGPGATNASIAVHTAQQDATPLVLFVGQVERKDRGKRAFQELDYNRTFGDMAKFVAEVHDPARLSETITRAFHAATTGAPGPSIVVLPEDMLLEEVTGAVQGPQPRLVAEPSPKSVAEAAALVEKAERPILIAGSRLGSPEGRAILHRAADAAGVPVLLSFRQQDLVDNAHPLYAGHLGYMLPKDLVALYQESDLVLAVGTRLGDVTTQGYVFPTAPRPKQRLVHVYDDPAVLGAVFATDLAVLAEPAAFLRAFAERAFARPARFAAWAERLHRVPTEMARWEPKEAPDGVVFGAVIAGLHKRLGDDAVFVNDAGNFSGWLGRYFPFKPSHRLLGPVSGAMGFGVPGAVAAARRLGRRVITLVGDGGFLMTGNELATAIQYRLPVTVIVANNGSYGTIRLHQEKFFPGRTIATELNNPDFARLGEAFGAKSFRIDRNADIDAALDGALSADGPSLVEVRTSLEHISAFTTLSALARKA